VSLQKRNPPAIHHHVVMLKGTGEGDTELLLKRLGIVGHRCLLFGMRNRCACLRKTGFRLGSRRSSSLSKAR
jgi:hypothetical protein